MLFKTSMNIVGDADIKRSVMAAREDVNLVTAFGIHGLSQAL
jgi:hypothetical protein